MNPGTVMIPEISVDVAEPAWREALPDAEAISRSGAAAAFAAAAPGPLRGRPTEAGVRLTGDAEVRRLNAEFRDRDAPTNVLSFPAMDDDDLGRLPPGAPVNLGDVVVAHGVVVAEARGEGKPLGDHLCHLVVHGMLHLLGFDHVEEADAEMMERLEADVLAGLGIADPYAAPVAPLSITARES